MKKNALSGMLFAFLPLSMLSTTIQYTEPTISPEITIESMQCSAIASREVIETSEEIVIQPETPKPATPQPVAPQTITAPADLDSLFEKYSAEYSVSTNTLKVIAKCESHMNPAALSKNGLYGGMFQFSASTWASNRRAMGLDENPQLRFDAEESIRTTAFKISRDGVGAWPHCGKKI